MSTKINSLPLDQGYKVYIATLTQSGTNPPVATVLENSIGSIVWSYSSVGNYFGTLTGAFPDQNKVFLICSPFPAQDGTQGVLVAPDNANRIFVSTFNLSDGSAADDDLNKTSIEIRVYP